MTTLELVHAALATVQDPELHRALPELGMVKAVEISGSTAKLEILLTISGCPMKDRLQKDIDTALTAVEGISAVEITFHIIIFQFSGTGKKIVTICFFEPSACQDLRTQVFLWLHEAIEYECNIAQFLSYWASIYWVRLN